MKLDIPETTCRYLEEPSLVFGGERQHVSPKQGTIRFGPRSIDMPSRHPELVRVGFVGSGESIESAAHWLDTCVKGVPGLKADPDFPGYMSDRGFFSSLRLEDTLVEKITQRDMTDLKGIRARRERFDFSVSLMDDKLRLLAERDRPPDYVVLALPREVVTECGTVDFVDKDLGAMHRDLRRALKAIAMKHRLTTQILLQNTTEAKADSSKVDHLSKCAWNFFTSLYYKCGGIPWMPQGLPAGTCYVGISFHRLPGSKRSVYFTGLAQAFDEYGNGLVLRGQDFEWDTQKHGSSPHLPEQAAEELIGAVLKRYRDEIKQAPRRVVVHKTSSFWPEERTGIQRALRVVEQHDLISVVPTDELRVLREARYPILRGSHVTFDKTHLLYTVGYIAALQGFPHGHVPAPLKLTDHVGDSSTATVLSEILVLTKMNWNSADFGGLLPITLKFATLVGEIMKEVPRTQDPQPQFKYYM
jgi:hypothetical protein